MTTTKKVVIVGAGPVGTLLSILLSQAGHRVEIYDKRKAPGERLQETRRSINLAVSHRAWRALEEAGMADELRRSAILMSGRMIHLMDETLSFQPYDGRQSGIYSMSREELNAVLVSEGTKQKAIRFSFEHEFEDWDPETGICSFQDLGSKTLKEAFGEMVIGADGVFSRFRTCLERGTGMVTKPVVYDYGYKELRIPADNAGGWRMERQALHIWPRGKFMLIALPNPDGTFTATLFMPLSGEQSFDAIRDKERFLAFFETYFSDLRELFPVLSNDYFSNSTSRLVTVSPRRWAYGNGLLIGDAAHAILPFFGQGMNAGFEDCQILFSLLRQGHGWAEAFRSFEACRLQNTDAIAELSLGNFTEMMEKTADPRFLLRKKIEQHLARLYPDRWTSLYSLVSFTAMPYAEAKAAGARQSEILNAIMAVPNIEKTWQSIDYDGYIGSLEREVGAGGIVSNIALDELVPGRNL